ncbi:MAG: glycosyltransferase [Microvirga sp.]|nr:glycosyltransferase [Microvirga sp.]
MRISAAMIVRNEERFLGDCLASLKGHVDEIVVVDTGSRDRTREIARAHGARLYEIPWPNDFAAARNYSLDQATGDWILWVDADDRLHVPEGVRLSELLDDPRLAGATLTLEWQRGLTPGTELRLFRNDPRIRFRGIIHENITSPVKAVCAVEGMEIRSTPLRLTHVGYEGDITHKHERNLALLRRAVQEEPDRPFYWACLAETLAALSRDDEAIAACNRAISAQRQLDLLTRRAYGGLAYQVLARILSNEGQDALPILNEAIESFPNECDLLFLRARALIAAGRHEEAVAILDDLVATDVDRPVKSGTSYDRRIFGEFAHDLRGIALLRLERFAEAAEAFERAAAAAAAAPDNLAYRAKAAAARGRAARTAARPS